MMDGRTRMILQGTLWGLVISAFILVIIAMIFQSPDTQEEKFKVIDQYQGCDVVRYTDPWGAKYHYFLHCK
jgi:hypothetical protein